MKLSAHGHYALTAMFELAHLSHGSPVPLKKISIKCGLPLPFLEKAFGKLALAGIIESVRGPKGGYALKKRCDELSIGEILRIVDSNLVVSKKGSTKSTASVMSALLYKKIDDGVLALLEKTTIGDICAESFSNTCAECNCKDFVSDIQDKVANGQSKGCAGLILN